MRGGRRSQTRRLEFLNVNEPVEYSPTYFQEYGANPFSTPPLQGCFTDVPSGGELLLIEMRDFHVGFLFKELISLYKSMIFQTRLGISAIAGKCSVRSRPRLRAGRRQ